MPTQLRPLGPAWQPLCDAAVDALVRGGLDVSGLWPTAALRQEALERLGGLLDRVVVWNARIDLTAARSERELVDLYLADALVLAAHGSAGTTSNESWVDVGSGAGAPGVALGLLWLAPELTLVEPRQKRVAFLRHVVGAAVVARPAFHVIEGRSEQVASQSHDVAISRATFAPGDWLREGARLARRGVWVLIARGAAPELDGWQPLARVDYQWPLTQAPRRAVAYSRQ